MKIAAYTIAKDEEKFVERWYESLKDADYLFILDTGSSDKTVEKARSLGINVVESTISPWRFDAARNMSLDLLPDDIDYCIQVDMDEVLQPGWYGKLENAFNRGVTRPHYRYIWSWNPDGSPGLQFEGTKFHTRYNYVWRHPVHEGLYSLADEKSELVDIVMEHHPDPLKSRSDYLHLLAMAVEEDPTDARDAFYFARELMYVGRKEDSIKQFLRYLNLPTAVWDVERSQACRYIAKQTYGVERLVWLERASLEVPDKREVWVDLAMYHYEKEDWDKCFNACEDGLYASADRLDYQKESFAWGYILYDLMAISSHNLGYKESAIHHGELACAMEPDDERLRKNLEYYVS